MISPLVYNQEKGKALERANLLKQAMQRASNATSLENSPVHGFADVIDPSSPR